jgi:hypothetical protein
MLRSSPQDERQTTDKNSMTDAYSIFRKFITGVL